MAARPYACRIAPTHGLGGGDREPIRFVTNGLLVMEIDGQGEAVINLAPVDTDPLNRSMFGRLFFRNTDVGMQACVRFPSGAIQILATEP